MPPTAPSDARQVRERLLDAVESLAARDGTSRLSHRAIARLAGVHASLLHYHFGTVEQALEDAVARRARRYADVQVAALRELAARSASVEDVVGALWGPFAALGLPGDPQWRDYLCLVARLAGIDGALARRHFADVDRAALRALASALPHAGDDALENGLRLTRLLFEREAIERCGRRPPPEPSLAQRERRLRTYAAAGLRALAGPPASLRFTPAT